MQSELNIVARDSSHRDMQIEPQTLVQRNLVFQIIKGHPEGITDKEISLFTGISRSSVNARRNEISNVGVVGLATVFFHDGRCRLNTLWGMKKDES